MDILRAVDQGIVVNAMNYARRMAQPWNNCQRPGTRIVGLLRTHNVRYEGLKRRILLQTCLALAMSRRQLAMQRQQPEMLADDVPAPVGGDSAQQAG